MDDDEAKALDIDNTHSEAGEEVVSGGNPTATPAPLKVSKGLEDADFSTLNLSQENVEKAYEAFKAERLEKLAYDSLSKQFETRLAEELEVKKAMAERNEYDAISEVAALKEEFAELRKSLSETEIRKAQEVALPEGFPTSMDAMEISYGTTDVLRLNVNFKFVRYNSDAYAPISSTSTSQTQVEQFNALNFLNESGQLNLNSENFA